ncbi:hypothetical protein ACLB1E_23615 [Escherichia coli]
MRWWKKPEIYSIKKTAGLLRQVMAHAEENVVVMTNFLSDFNASIQFEITEPELQYMLWINSLFFEPFNKTGME